jgi:raffinose/stachyose/melibiose transport system substrate-binding protein
MKMRTLRAIFALLIVAGLLTGACGKETETASVEEPTSVTSATEKPEAKPTEEPEGCEPVELKFSIRLSEPGEIWPYTLDTFNEAHECDIHVTMTYVDDTTYKTKSPIELRSDNPPDVFFSWEGGWAKFLIDAGFAEPLDRYYEKYNWDEILSPGAVSLATYDGTKYFVAYYMASAAMWYRPDILDQFGLVAPATWDELLDVCETLKENDVSCFMWANKEKWLLQFEWTAILVNKHGLDVWEGIVNNEIPWTDPRSVDTFATIKELMDLGYVYPNPNSVGMLEASVPYASGEVAFWYQGSWMPMLFGMGGEAPFVYDYVQFPAFEGVDPVMEVFAEETLMIHANSQHKDEAAEFINWVVSEQIQNERAKMMGYFPANINADLSLLYPEILGRLGEDMLEAGPFTYMHVDHAVSPPIADEFLDALQALIEGAITPEEAAEITEAEAIVERGPVE